MCFRTFPKEAVSILFWLGEKIPIAGCTGEPLCAGGLVGGVHGAATGSATTAAGRLNVLAAAGLLNVLAAAGLLITGAGGFACILVKLDTSVWVTEPSGHQKALTAKLGLGLDGLASKRVLQLHGACAGVPP